MSITPTPKKLVAVQVTMVHREGDEETLKCVDIPIRNPYFAVVELDTNEYGIYLKVNVRNDPNYTISYVLRDHQAVHEEDGKLHPYCNGINSDTDMSRLRERLERAHAIAIDVLEKKVQRRDRTLRKVRKELKELKEG